MLRASARPASSRLTRAASVKIKAVNLVPSTATTLNWAGLWAGYGSQSIPARLDAIKAIGANAAKITCEGVNTTVSGVARTYPADAALLASIADFCVQLRSRGLRLYLNLSSGANLTCGSDGSQVVANTALHIKVMRWFMMLAPDLLIGVDVCNEVNFNRPSTWPASSTAVNAQMSADLAYLIGQVRAIAPGLPVTFSVYMSSPTGFAGNALLRLQHDLGCDFHDYHPYNGLNGNTALVPGTSAIPAGADPAQLEAQSWFIGRHLIGENGLRTDNSAAAMMAWVNGLGDQARRSASHGAVLFADVDFNGTGEVGKYGISGVSAITTPFGSWPGNA